MKVISLLLALFVLGAPLVLAAPDATQDPYKTVIEKDKNGKVDHILKYDKKTGKLLINENYDDNGKIRERKLYDPKTGARLTYEKYYTDGTIRKRKTYDKDSGERKTYEVFGRD